MCNHLLFLIHRKLIFGVNFSKFFKIVFNAKCLDVSFYSYIDASFVRIVKLRYFMKKYIKIFIFILAKGKLVLTFKTK